MTCFSHNKKPTHVLKVKLLSAKATPPTKGTAQSIRYDLYASQYCVLSACKTLLHTGVAIELPKNSSLIFIASAYGINIGGGGVIDPDYKEI